MSADSRTPSKFPLIYAWGNNPVRARLKGKRCRVVATGYRMNSIQIEFEDGTQIITSKRSVRDA